MKRIAIFLCVLILLTACNSNEEEKSIVQEEVVDNVIVKNEVKDIKVTIIQQGIETILDYREELFVEKGTIISIVMKDHEKQWSMSDITVVENISVNEEYIFSLSEIVDVISTFGQEHTQVMAEKSMFSWTIVTDNYISNASGDYINETVYEGQFKSFDLDLSSFKRMYSGELTLTTELHFEELYYLTEEVESLHSHSHNHNGTKEGELLEVSYTIEFTLVKENNNWKVDKIDFPSIVMEDTNSLKIKVDSTLYSPSEEAINIAQYYLDYQQIDQFLNQFYEDYIHALNFNDVSYIEDYVIGRTIFHENINTQDSNKLIELIFWELKSMERQEENYFLVTTYVERTDKKEIEEIILQKEQKQWKIVNKKN